MKKFHSALFDFCWFPNYDASIEYLANNIADPEPWDFSDATQAKYSILKSYIEHTFRKIKSENKISFSSDNNFACFNTGLVTANLESIFALAERNNRPDVAEKGLSPYVFKAFVRESDIQLISKFGDNIPDIADFFQKPEDLIFNPQCRVVPQIDHIIADNMDRFPAQSATACSIDNSGSCIWSRRSLATCAIHCLKGSAFCDGIDWIIRRTVFTSPASVLRITPVSDLMAIWGQFVPTNEASASSRLRIFLK